MKYYLGIDLGGTNIAAGVVDENRRIIASHSRPTDAQRPFEAVVEDMAEAAMEAVRAAGLTLADFTSIGVGTPSYINPRTGLLVFANNLGWHNVPLAKQLNKHIALPVFIRNDADCAAYGELLAGAAAGATSALMITLGTGVGGGIILNGKIFSGADNMGAEFGHMLTVYGGEPCSCGQLGCFEAYASATALIRQTRAAMEAHPDSLMHELAAERGKVSGRTAFDAAKRGDVAGQAVVEQYIAYIASGLASLVNIFRPAVIIIGGGIAGEGAYLLKPLNAKLRALTLASDEIGTPPVVAARLGNDAGIIGAAMLELQQD